MTTDMINLKLERSFLKEIDSIVKEENYHNRTEFIRQALREKVKTTKQDKLWNELEKLRGSVKRKTSEEEYERMREEGFQKLERKFSGV